LTGECIERIMEGDVDVIVFANALVVDSPKKRRSGSRIYGRAKLFLIIVAGLVSGLVLAGAGLGAGETTRSISCTSRLCLRRVAPVSEVAHHGLQ
jgi:hypothetical protein